MNPATPPEEIAADDQRFLLELARATIDARLSKRPLPSPTPDSALLLETRGAFVTLKIEGRLRGCIGHVIGVAPLWRAVRDNAIAAAFEDPRFPPLTPDELQQVGIEISVLTPLVRSSAKEVVVGRHGILVERGAARGLLLPQVADEYGRDRETFLDHTCRKAGLEPGCWRQPDTTISTFSAEVFGEKPS
jgi:AmmeMemoRadiSam system protein A